MPDGDKSAYLEARTIAPDVVARESPTDRFLLCEDGNTEQAARRLASYWRCRKELFGDQAFKPMLATGSGALSDADVEILATGAVAMLPPDLEGRPVFYLDRDRLTIEQIQNELARCRCFFYLLQLGCTNIVAQTRGIVCLASVANKRKAPIADRVFNRHANGFSKNFPMKVACTHLLAIASNSALKVVVDGLLAIGVKMASYHTKHPIKCHRGSSGEEVLEMLRRSRLSKRSVPDEYGGSWSIEKYQQWHRKQTRTEVQNFMTPEEQLNRKRKINLVHSRQKRLRRKIEEEVLGDQVTALQSIISEAKKKRVKLEALVIAAQNIVDAHKDGSTTNRSLVDAQGALSGTDREANAAYGHDAAIPSRAGVFDSIRYAETNAMHLSANSRIAPPAGVPPLTVADHLLMEQLRHAVTNTAQLDPLSFRPQVDHQALQLLLNQRSHQASLDSQRWLQDAILAGDTSSRRRHIGPGLPEHRTRGGASRR